VLLSVLSRLPIINRHVVLRRVKHAASELVERALPFNVNMNASIIASNSGPICCSLDLPVVPV
jgi:hypothetical protein